MFGRRKDKETPVREKKKKHFGVFKRLREELVSLSKPSPVQTVSMTVGVIAGAYAIAAVISVVDLLIVDVIRLFL